RSRKGRAVISAAPLQPHLRSQAPNLWEYCETRPAEKEAPSVGRGFQVSQRFTRPETVQPDYTNRGPPAKRGGLTRSGSTPGRQCRCRRGPGRRGKADGRGWASVLQASERKGALPSQPHRNSRQVSSARNSVAHGRSEPQSTSPIRDGLLRW